jgi:hypothetical protein
VRERPVPDRECDLDVHLPETAMQSAMNGNRRPDGTKPRDLLPGEYCRWLVQTDRWSLRTPNGILMLLEPGHNHQITENVDGTLTITPSMLKGPSARDAGWHGYLTNGVWTEC